MLVVYGAGHKRNRARPSAMVRTRNRKSEKSRGQAYRSSYGERSNLTKRMHMRRVTRLTNAFSKKLENHAAAIALHTMYYNFVRIHQTLRVTPAMAAGVSKTLWDVSDIVVMQEQWELANYKPEYNFVVQQYAIGKGHSVSVLWRGGEVDTIFGFEKEADAPQWIKEKSRAWVVEQNRAKRVE
jgi:hypothetical protein